MSACGIIWLILTAALSATSAPSSSAPSASAPDPMAIPTPDLRAALLFTDSERQILSTVHDGDGLLDNPALYVLLRRARMLPPGREVLEEADQPNPRNLWDDPARYRGQLVRVSGLFAAKTLDWPAQVTTSPGWGSRPVYATYISAPDWPEPMVVFLPEKPPDWAKGAKVEVSGYFYKLLRQASARQPSNLGLYPVLVARQLYRPSMELPGLTSIWNLIIGLAAILAIVFFVLRRRTRRKPGDSLEHLRKMATTNQPDQPMEKDGPVDEELARQVEQYQARHGKDTKAKHEDR